VKRLFNKKLPTICFVGPMLGKHPGWAPNPMEFLAPRLEEKGYTCLLTSNIINRYLRLMDIIITLIKYRKNIDILCLQVYGGRSFIVEDITSWLGKKLNFGIIMVLHGGAIPQFMTYFPKWSKRVFQRAHVLISPSMYLSNFLKKYGLNVHIIPNAIQISDYPYKERSRIKPRLLWMRTFHNIYNPLMALDVLSKVKQKQFDVLLTMAGQDKGLLSYVKQKAEQKGLYQYIRFVGFLDLKSKIREFSYHDIFINTSHIDNMPVSLIEALACGLPVVTTAVGGIPYMLEHNETGLLVPDGDVLAMVEAIIQLLQKPTLVQKLSQNGRRLAEQWDWSNIIPKWKKIFEEVLTCVAFVE